MRRITAVSALALLAACNQSEPVSVTVDEVDVVGDGALALFTSEGQLSFASVASDRGAQVYTDVTLTVPDEDGETHTIHAARMIADGSASDLDRLRIEEITLHDDAEDGAFTIASITVDDPNAAMSTLVNGLLNGDASSASTRLSDYEVDTVDFDTLNFLADDDDGTAAFTISNMRIENLKNGLAGMLEVSGMILNADSRDGDRFTMSLGRFALEDMEFGYLQPFLDVDDPSNPFAIQQAAMESGVNDPYAKRWDSFILEDFEADAAGISVTMNTATGSMNNTRGGVETVSSFGPINVAVTDPSTDAGAQVTAFLGMMGYTDGLEFSGEARQIADPMRDEVRVTRNRFVMTDGFTLDMEMTLGGMRDYAQRMGQIELADAALDELGAPAIDAAMQDAMSALTMSAFELRLRDESIVDRALTAASVMMGSSKDDLRDQAGAQLMLGAAFAPKGAPRDLALAAAGAVGEFVKNGGELVVSLDVTEDEPLRFADYANASSPTAIPTPPLEFKRRP